MSLPARPDLRAAVTTPPRRAALCRSVRLGLGAAVVAASLGAGPAAGSEPPQPSPRLLWREADAFLALTAGQRQALQALHEAQERRLQALRDAHARQSPAVPTPTLCQQARQVRADWLAGSRAVLTPPQLARLAQLEAAFSLMPVIESAQAAGLLDDRVALPPRGLPEGRVANVVSWVRMPAPALPGCPPGSTTVVPEVERDPPDAPASRPRP